MNLRIIVTSCLLLIAINFQGLFSANILFYHHIISYSHRVQTYPLAFALAEKGHDVTIISPYYPRSTETIHPKVKEIVPPAFAKTTSDFVATGFTIDRRVNKEIPRIMYGFYDTAYQACEDLLVSVEFNEYLDKTETLDLLIVDNCMAECILGVVHKYNTKYIYFQAVPFLGNEYDTIGLSPDTSSIPELDPFSFSSPMTFWERVVNTLSPIQARYEHYKYMTKLDKLVRKYMNMSDMPILDDVSRNASLIFYTGDVITDYVRSLPPNVVNVAGIHCRNSTGELPENIQKFIGNATDGDGFIFISLGSAVRPATLPTEIRQAFYDAISSFPKLKFLWRWSGELPTNIPKNLYVNNWFPQNDLLAHPRIRVFVTQSGRPSTVESLCNAVPMISFPVLSDQDNNANKIQLMDGGVVLELGTVTKEQLVDAIMMIAYGNGHSKKKRMEVLRQIFNDRPMTPLNTALWWVDYVLRHDDLSHLRPAGFYQTWHERRFLDVWAFIYASFLTALILTIIVLRKVFRVLCVLYGVIKNNRKIKRE